ncbi:unnamed protein product [Pleuronectes platessa]|uniref:Uncharacterized protein n=1 Tax=Pleuronectes platessa TaxID=8262 RepID=A0A9N7YG50_PLEPL|nr:unnamed protein product [Pleuronectes platessa]
MVLRLGAAAGVRSRLSPAVARSCVRIPVPRCPPPAPPARCAHLWAQAPERAGRGDACGFQGRPRMRTAENKVEGAGDKVTLPSMLTGELRCGVVEQEVRHESVTAARGTF